MIYGLGSGVLWALETILLSRVLAAGVFTQSAQAIFLAPFVSACLNDALSALWLLIFRKTVPRFRPASVWSALRTKHGKLLLLSGLCGGPLGMSAYLLSIKYVGPSYTTVLSALYPALGAVVAWIVLRNRLSKKQVVGILLCVLGSVGMVGMPGGAAHGGAYFLFALACALLWGMEAVISSYVMQREEISFETALQIRQCMSIVCYAALFLPLLHAWGFTLQVLTHQGIWLLLLTALLETGSYLLYYKSISVSGAARAMSLNITYIVWAAVFSMILLGEMPQMYQILSIAVLMAGVLKVVR